MHETRLSLRKQGVSSHLEKRPVVTAVQSIEKGAEVGDGVDDGQDLGGIHHLGLEVHPVQGCQGGDHRVEDAALVGEQLAPATHT